jgi:hypothetical protein
MVFTIKNPDGKATGSMDWKALREYSIQWHKKNNGVDFSKIKIK